MRYLIAAASEKGENKITNQDGFAVLSADAPCGQVVFAVLCDGMGGYSEGEIASSSLVNAFSSWFNEDSADLFEQPIDSRRIRLEWEEIIHSMNAKLIQYGKERNSHLGTTVTVLLLTPENYYIMNVGDSRAYQITSEVYQITKDHSLVQREIDNGNITKEEARHDSRRNILLQGVGVKDAVIPDYYAGRVWSDTVFLLSSDGFYHELTEEELMTYLKPDAVNSQEKLFEILNHFVRTNRARGERDDISVVAIRPVIQEPEN